MKTMTVKVTKDDIKRGHPANPFCCPIAKATRREVKDLNVYVAYSAVRFRTVQGDTLCSMYMLSKPALEFMRNFDKGKKVKPATFKLTHLSGAYL